ncbi:hypothetical protein TIFTF001_007998 [Ficus carica]|uniref:Homeobox domain-containing protein n=1 Tax=Ficus carica TaxID=3494 RepID=A0AA88D1D8_FICCA|nr:hypothetical protein TIFTF001_007998 [Ficus carica]
MWMMGCSTEHGNELQNMPGSFKDLKLRPLIIYSPLKTTVVSPTTPVTDCTTKSTTQDKSNIIVNTEQRRRKDLNVAQVVPLQSTRWSPTPEQLMALQELYRRGKRTPTAQQIQEITAKLRRFGKIEGKNVFYWFQNHKARDKKKQRLKMGSQCSKKMEPAQFDHYSKSQQLETKTSGLSSGPRVTGPGVEQTKREPLLSNYSRISEESVNSMPRVTTTTKAAEERSGTNNNKKVVSFKEEKLNQLSQLTLNTNNTTTQDQKHVISSWKPMEIMSYTFPSYNHNNNNNYHDLMINRTRPPTVISLTFDENLMVKKQDDVTGTVSLMPNGKPSFTSFGNYGIFSGERETLELFPLRSENLKGAQISSTDNQDDQITKIQSSAGTRDYSDFKQDLSLSFFL